MNILGLDLSLTRTGYATAAASGVLVPPKGRDRGVPRLAWFRGAVLALLDGAELVVLEGYSFGQTRGSSHSHALGELGGVVRLLLFDNLIPYVEVAPATLKRFACGKGNAPKAEVLVSAVRRLGYEGADHNQSDALWLWYMAAAHYGLPGAVTVPQAHRAALEAVKWPERTLGRAA